MKAELLQEIINKISSVKIAVIGDFCLDAYWFVDESKSEISVETGHATRPVHQQKYSLGGAGNVANNLAAMEVKEIRAFGVIGPDPFGPEMISLMRKAGINTDNILTQQKKWATHVYIKPYINNNEENRIDFGNFNKLSEETANLLINNLRNSVNDVDLVIINQQVLSGIHTDYFKKKLVEVINSFPKKIFIVDSRNYTDFYSGAFRKMNDTEASLLCGIKRKPDEIVPYSDVINAAKTLYHRYQKPLFITRGSRGSLTVNESGVTETLGLMIISKVDSVGAGDSYLAGAAATLAACYPMEIAAEMGSYVAGVTVQKLLQTGTASPSEILWIGQNHDYIYLPELAEDIRHARYLKDTEIEIIREWTKDRCIKHAIFDHDGTISTLREGWEHIMAPMMIKAVLGDKFHEADETLYHKIESSVREFINKTTGIQTLMQMKILLDVIREFSCVPDDQMLDEFGYKEIYNNDLMQMVYKREKKLISSELSVADFTIKNAVPFFTKLKNAGVTLYLASGTDEEDVKHEAAVLGYDALFEGGIFGAVGDINKDAKKIVLDRILDMIGESENGQIATIGDGPVEIRETHKRGGITIGVASNELKRFGLNQIKRTRLINAGADIIIPDFSQSSELLNLLNIK
ncbi:MAG TPA: PfkB family carbohydrate kinase [Bacteroidales bacterium]|nr:PfkB family carbohydrate kinase [Bacteroidales bacterium]